MEWFEKNDELKREFVKNNVANNEYYENIRNEYNTTDNKDDFVEEIMYCYEDQFDCYYSLYAVMDSIEEYMREHSTNIKQTIKSEDFMIKDRF